MQWRLKDTFIFCVNRCSERRDKLHCEQRSERVIELQHECVSSGLRWVLGELGILLRGVRWRHGDSNVLSFDSASWDWQCMFNEYRCQ